MADSKVCNSTVQEKEIWKDVKGYEGLYKVSSLGRVKSKRRQGCKGGIKKQHSHSAGYKVINLTKNGKSKVEYVHRLVAKAFISNPENKKCINHINSLKTDNKIENLEWCTKKENNKHAKENGLNPDFYDIKQRSKLTEKEVVEIRKRYGKNGNTLRSLALEYGVSYSNIHSIVSNNSWINL